MLESPITKAMREMSTPVNPAHSEPGMGQEPGGRWPTEDRSFKLCTERVRRSLRV
jgi:hypothetical protein